MAPNIQISKLPPRTNIQISTLPPRTNIQISRLPPRTIQISRLPPRTTLAADNLKLREHFLDVAPPIQDFSIFEHRLETYTDWPNEEVSKEDLAKAGFIYTGHGDVVVCPLCKIEGHEWVSGDDPMADHRTWNPHCLFIRRNIGSNAGSSTLDVDTCGLYGVLPNSFPEDEKPNNFSRLIGPQNQEKVTFESRLATFTDWPKSLKQRPADLAEAGFYYTGAGDQTLCFYCGGGLKDWEENDDPWEQHALWFSKCVFVNLKKGNEYIKEVENKCKPYSAAPGSSDIQTEEAAGSLSSEFEEIKIKSERESKSTEKTLCKICYKNELGVVFLPCGHIVACADCAAALKNCAVCRKPLEATVRAFLS